MRKSFIAGGLGIVVLAGTLLAILNPVVLSAIGGVSPLPVRCDADNRLCLMEAAADIHLLRLRKGNPSQVPYIARDVAELLELVQFSDERDAILKRFRDLPAPEEFLERAERGPATTDWITAEKVRSSFSRKQSLVRGDFEFWAKYALESLAEKDPAAALDIWEEFLPELQESSQNAGNFGYRLALKHSPVAAERFHRDFPLPDSAGYDGFELLAAAAAQWCRSNPDYAGQSLLTILDRELDERSKAVGSTSGLYVIDAAPRTEAVLYCTGEEAARAFQTEILRLTADVIRQIRQDDAKADQIKNFEVGVVRSEVGEGAVVPFVLWLVRQGRSGEAAEMLSAFPYHGSSSTLGGISEDGILSLEAATINLEELVRFDVDGKLYSGKPAIVLDTYLNQFPDQRVSQLYPGHMMQRVHSAISALWPEPKAAEAAGKYLHQLNVARRNDALHREDYLSAVLQQAKTERLSGCFLTDGQLESVLDEIRVLPQTEPNYGSVYPADYLQANALHSMSSYLSAPDSRGNGPCLLKEWNAGDPF